MELYLELQALLLKWIRYHNVRSMQQIRLACKNLTDSFSISIERKYYLYYIFSPLVRMGFVEFVGQGKYQAASPVIIHDKKQNISTGVNLNDSHIDYIQKNFNVIYEPDLFKIIRFKSNYSDLKTINSELQIDFTENNITDVLSQFPKLQDVILQFKKNEASIYPTCYYDVFKHCWEDEKDNLRSGIHKMNKDAQKYYFINSTGECFNIPDSESNPDARYICESYQALLTKKRPFMFYSIKERQLSISRVSVPILIDRILRIPALHLVDGACFEQSKQEHIYKNINMSAFRQLNRIFSNGIKLL